MVRFFWALALGWLLVTAYEIWGKAPRQAVGQTLLMVGINGIAALTLQWLRDRRSRR